MAGHRGRSTISSAPFSPHQIDRRDIAEQSASCSGPPEAGIGDAYWIVQGSGSSVCAACRDDEEADRGSRRVKYRKSRRSGGTCGKAAECFGEDLPPNQRKPHQKSSNTRVWCRDRRAW